MDNKQNQIEDCINVFKSFFQNNVLPQWKKGFEYFQTIKDYDINNLDLEKQGYIRDPIWGEIRLNMLELEILDSFFIQRLRDITQMGGIKFIYPAANHKRFDHSLGTFAAISFILNERILKRRQKNYYRKLTSIYKHYKLINPTIANEFKELENQNFQSENNSDLNKTKESKIKFKQSEKFRTWLLLNMKLSMLMHDIGHYPFSHLFEIFLRRNQNIVRNYRNDVKEYIKNPHEYRTRQIITGEDPVLNLFIDNSALISIKEKIQKLGLDVDLISGSITRDSKFVLSQLVNGVLDADKLDYLTRDNYFAIASFPLNIFDRIYRKVEFIEVDGEKELKMVFDEKVISAILKIIINRTFEFNDIINHPVSLCFRGMFNACLERIFQLYDMKTQTEILKRMELMNDDQLLRCSTILANNDRFINDLLYRITFRRLYKQVRVYQKSEFPLFIKLMSKAEKESLFIDAKLFKFCVSENGTCSSEFNSLIEGMENHTSGILIFYNEGGKSISEYFKEIWINLKNNNTIISFNEYINNKYLNQFDSLSKFESENNRSVADLFDFFNIMEDKIYIYTAKVLLDEARLVFKHLEESENALTNFFTKAAENIPSVI